ncbi:AMP-binding protein [Herbiconiux sp.]|uniref:AMP-binding protein n=1 Tax=Herbiconiux sp. TaxID=1871186 RepID=UPI0025BA8AE9|nr:AMP-binding protein [Herbiconiux sp.]
MTGTAATAQNPAPAAVTEAIRSVRDRLIRLREHPVEAAAGFAWPAIGPVFNWGIDWFDAIARGNDAPALVIVEEDGSRTTRSFDEMATRSDQLGTWLRDLGVSKGDAVMLMLGNQVELWESMLALIKIGAVILPTTVAFGGDELQNRLERGRVRFVIAAAADTPKFDQVTAPFAGIRVQPNRHFPHEDARVSVRSDVSGEGREWGVYEEAFVGEVGPLGHPGTAPGDALLHYFTSGTTSRPKLVEHTQVSYPVGHLSTMYWLGLRPGDVHLAISSPGWAKHAWSCFFAPWIAEATIFVSNYTRFDPERMLTTLRTDGVTSFCAPPTVWRMLIQSDLTAGEGRGALRELVSAGEPLNPEVIGQVRRQWGLDIRDGYGQTEMTAIVANSPGQTITDGSMGRPLPGCPVVLVDPLTGEHTDEGEICLDLAGSRPLNLMTGYVADEERNAEATVGGRFHTGDLASRDADGYLTYIGRTDDVFKASDYKISPFELESVLIEHPAVVEAAIVPAPDELRLAVPKAYIALAAGHAPDAATAESILLFAREALAPFQRVRRVEFFELPKTISGKIRRVELRQREERIAAGTETCDEFRDDRLRNRA